MLNLGSAEGIAIKKLDHDVGSTLKNHPDFVYIETTKEQDQSIAQQAFQKQNTMDQRQYRLWTNNCNISFFSICGNAGVKIPELQARPDKYLDSLLLSIRNFLNHSITLFLKLT